MELQRYSPFCTREIFPSSNSTLVRFPRQIKSEGIFASPSIFSSASFASQYTSISFLPRHRYSFDPSPHNILDNEGNSVLDPFSSEVKRAWPAFGKHGGGQEVFIEMDVNDTIPISGQHQYLDGGFFDLYHQDAILPLAEATLSLISTGAAGFLDGSAGVTKNGLPVFKSTIGEELFSISVGIKETPDGTMLHLWGVKWRDNNHHRFIYCNIEDHFEALSSGSRDLAAKFMNKSDPITTEFVTKIKTMISILESAECYPRNWPVYRFYIGYSVRLP